MMNKQEQEFLQQLYSKKPVTLSVWHETLKPSVVLAEFNRGRTIDSIANSVWRSGLYKTKQESADYVRRCVYDSSKMMVNP